MQIQTAVEWLQEQINLTFYVAEASEINKRFQSIYEQAKEMEKEQIGYTEEQAYEIWKAGQKYWETSGKSITFEELIEKFKNK